MVLRIPYARVIVAALVSTAVVGILLNLVLHEWFGAMFLAQVIVFQAITLTLAVRSLVGWIINRRRPRDDPPGHQKDFGLAA